jgi:hypothetical protein
MDGNDRLRAWRNPAGYVRRIDQESFRVDVSENDPGAHLMDRFRRRDVGKRRGDDFVVRADFQRPQRQGESVRTRIDADPEARVRVSGDLAFEGLDVGSEDVVCPRQNFLDGWQQFALQRRRLRRQVQKGYLHEAFGGLYRVVC